MKVPIEVSKLIRQIIGIRNDVKSLLTKFVLHFDDIGTKPVFSCELKAIGEVVNLLVFIQIVVDVLLVGLT